MTIPKIYAHPVWITKLMEKMFKKGYYEGVKLLILVIFLISLSQVVFGISKVQSQVFLIDFNVYYQASKTLLSDQNPYHQVFNTVPFNYPPSSFLFFVPFTLLGQKEGQVLFTLLSLLSLLSSSYFLTSLFPITSKWTVRLFITSLFLQNFPAKFTLTLGQVNLIVLLLLILMFVFEKKRKDLWTGICFGLASMVKLTPIILGLYLLFKKRFLALFIGIGMLLLSNLFFIWRWPETASFFQSILPQLNLQTGMGASLYDQSLRAFLSRIGLTFLTCPLSLIIVSILVVLSVVKFLSQRDDLVFFSLLLAITTIGNSFTWQHHLVFLFPAFLAETVYFLQSKSVLRGIILATSFAIVGYHFPDIASPPTTNPIFVFHSLMGTLILIGLLLTHRTVKSRQGNIGKSKLHLSII